MESQNIPLEFLHCNEGQLEGVPANPRTIRGERFEALKKSLTEFKEMTELRPLIGVPYGDKGEVVVIAGNMRLRAAQSLNWDALPCILLSESTPAERLREIAIKDNLPYGDNDWDALANEWDTAELTGWGMELPTDWGAGEGTKPIPDSLAGEDIDPDELPKLEGDDVTARGRVIITYPNGREGDMAKLLGLTSITKVVYDISELPLAGE